MVLLVVSSWSAMADFRLIDDFKDNMNNNNWTNTSTNNCQITRNDAGYVLLVATGGDPDCSLGKFFNTEFNETWRIRVNYTIAENNIFFFYGGAKDTAVGRLDAGSGWGAGLRGGDGDDNFFYDDGGLGTQGTFSKTLSNWYLSEITYNSSTGQWDLYNWDDNAAKPATASSSKADASPDARGHYLTISIGGGGTYSGDAYISEVWIDNGTSPPAPTYDLINITNAYPTAPAQFNSEFNINLTFNSTYNSECKKYLNGTLNGTKSFTAGTDVFVSWNETLPDGIYNITLTCGNQSDNESTYLDPIYFDASNPTITLDTTLNQIQYSGNLTANFTLTDNILIHSYNITIDHTTYITNKTNVSSTSASVNISYDLDLLSAGWHNLTVKLADGHTSKTIRHNDWKLRNGLFNDYMKYEWVNSYSPGEVTIKQKDGSIFDSWDSISDFDRFRFTFEPNTPSTSYTFEVESDKPIQYVEAPNTKYKKWLIVNGEHWLDFYFNGEEEVEFNQVEGNPKEWEVTVSNLPIQDSYTFNSIGDLNIVETNYSFYNTKLTATYTSPVTELQQQTVTFNITKPNNNYDFNYVNFSYNGTQYTLTETNISTEHIFTTTFISPNVDGYQNMTLNFTFSMFNSTETAIANSTNLYNQSIYNLGIDNCSTYTIVAINLTLRDSTSDKKLTGYIDGQFNAWLSDMGNFAPFNLSWGNSPNAGVCIQQNGTYNFSAQLEYGSTSDDYTDATYYFTNASMSNLTQDVSLYLTNDTTLVLFNVLDENDQDVQDVYIKVLKYDLGTDSYVLEQILKTDSDGNAVGNIILNTQFYKFILELDGEQVFESDPTKIVTTQKTFRITVGTDFFANYGTVRDITGDVSFNNNTKVFTYVYSDSTGGATQACLTVERNSINGDTQLDSSCQSAAAGTIQYTIAEATATNTYTGTGTITYEAEEYVVDVETATYNDRYKVFGLEGILIVFYLIVTLVMIGVSSLSPVIAIAMMLIGFIASVLLGVFYMNWYALSFFIVMGLFTIYRVSRGD